MTLVVFVIPTKEGSHHAAPDSLNSDEGGVCALIRMKVIITSPRRMPIENLF